MKNVKFLPILLLWVGQVFGQTSYYSTHIQEVGLHDISIKNTWFGSKLALTLSEEPFTPEATLFSGKVLYELLKKKQFAIPIVSTAALNSTNLFLGESGLNLGLYPYYIVKEAEDFIFVLHGGLGYKKIIQEGGEGAEQTRFILGGEILIPTKYDLLSISLHHTSWINPQSTRHGVEGTLIVPLMAKIGLLLECVQTYEKQPCLIVRVGIINSLKV